MRYKLSIDRTVNRLVPHYLSGRKFILFVQSCLYPLQRTNEWFRSFTRERHIEARMTSQVIYFEWFLNYRFGKYIKDGKDRIFIKDSTSVGVDLYHEGRNTSVLSPYGTTGNRLQRTMRRNAPVRSTCWRKRS